VLQSSVTRNVFKSSCKVIVKVVGHKLKLKWLDNLFRKMFTTILFPVLEFYPPEDGEWTD